MDKKEKKPAIEENFELDQVVWAKLKGFPWWPGVIREIIRNEKDKGKKEYMVFFLGEFTR
jgi:PWWP domain.